jgi:hypothetical protein
MSEDLRSRVTAAVEGSISWRTVAERFGVARPPQAVGFASAGTRVRSAQNHTVKFGDHSASSPMAAIEQQADLTLAGNGRDAPC